MYNTQYFWGKEDNPNINSMNCSMNAFSDTVGSVGSLGIIVLLLAVGFIALYCLSCRAF